jgi:hypothetical protein
MRRECLHLMLESRYKFHANKRPAFNLARLRVDNHMTGTPEPRAVATRPLLPTSDLNPFGVADSRDLTLLTCFQPSPRPAGHLAVCIDLKRWAVSHIIRYKIERHSAFRD